MGYDLIVDNSAADLIDLPFGVDDEAINLIDPKFRALDLL